MNSASNTCKTHEDGTSLTTGLVACEHFHGQYSGFVLTQETSVTALVAQVWDISVYFSDEVEHLWRYVFLKVHGRIANYWRRGKMNRIKIFYFLSRYLLLFFNV